MIRIAKEEEFKKLTEIWEESVKATHTFLSLKDIDFFRPKILNEYLYINEQNENAVNFYKYMNFKVIGRSNTDSLGKPFLKLQ